MRKQKVLIIGDSITTNGAFDSWADYVAEALPEVEFSNRAVGGTSSQTWSPRYDFLSLGEPGRLEEADDGQDVAAIFLGANDGLGFIGESMIPNLGLEFHLAMSDIIDRLLDRPSWQNPRRLVVVATPLQSNRAPSSTFNILVHQQHQWAAKQFWPKSRVEFVLSHITPLGYNERDVHPNEVGQRQLAAQIQPAIERALRKAS